MPEEGTNKHGGRCVSMRSGSVIEAGVILTYALKLSYCTLKDSLSGRTKHPTQGEQPEGRLAKERCISRHSCGEGER